MDEPSKEILDEPSEEILDEPSEEILDEPSTDSVKETENISIDESESNSVTVKNLQNEDSFTLEVQGDSLTWESRNSQETEEDVEMEYETDTEYMEVETSHNPEEIQNEGEEYETECVEEEDEEESEIKTNNIETLMQQLPSLNWGKIRKIKLEEILHNRKQTKKERSAQKKDLLKYLGFSQEYISELKALKSLNSKQILDKKEIETIEILSKPLCISKIIDDKPRWSICLLTDNSLSNQILTWCYWKSSVHQNWYKFQFKIQDSSKFLCDRWLFVNESWDFEVTLS